MVFEYPEYITTANLQFEMPDDYILLIPLSLAVSIAARRQYRRQLIIFPKCVIIIASVLSGIIALNTNHLASLKIPNTNLPLKIAECAYAPIYLLLFTYSINTKAIFKDLPVLIVFAVLLLGNGFIVGYLMTFLYSDLTILHVLVMTATLSTTQPDYMILFLAQNDSYKSVINYLQGENLISLLLTFPLVEYMMHMVTDGTPSEGATWWYFCIGHIVGMFLGWVVAKLTAMIMKNCLLTLEGIYAIIIGALTFVYVCCIIESIAGFTASLVFCLVLKGESNINIDMSEAHYRVLLRITYEIIDGTVFFYSTSQALIWCFNMDHLDMYFYCFALITGLRLISVIVVHLILRRLKKSPILYVYLHSVVCPTSTFSLIFASQFYYRAPEVGGLALAHTLVNAGVSMLVNNFLGINLMKWTHIGYISKASTENMERTLHVVKTFRDSLVHQKKLDRAYAQVNWEVVNIYAKLTLGYPYPPFDKPIDWEGKHDRVYNDGPMESLCCQHCPNMIRRFDADFQEVALSTQRKVMINLMKSVVRRMCRHCLIDTECGHILANVISQYEEGKSETPIQVFHDMQKSKRMPKGFKKLFGLITYQRMRNIPHKRLYRLFFFIRTNTMYQILNYVVTIALLLPILLKLLLQSLTRNHETHAYFIGFLFCLFDFFVDVFAMSYMNLAQGIRTYFRSFWRWMDFFALIGAVCLCLASCLTYMGYTSLYVEIIRVFCFLMYLRAFRILHFIPLILPKLVVWMEFGGELKKIKVYQCAVAMNDCINEVLLYCQRWGQEVKPAVLEELKRTLRQSKLELCEIIIKLESDMPLYTSTIKTKRTLIAARCCMNDYLVKQKIQGNINNDEFSRLKTSIYYTRTSTENAIPPTNPTLLFLSNYWISSTPEAADYLRGKAVMQKWPSQHILVMAGQKVIGVYLLVNGHLRIKDRVIHRGEKDRKVRYMEYENDFISPGNCFGEIELFTTGKYAYTLLCQGECRTYFIDMASFYEALKLSEHPITGLAATLWKRKMMSLASEVLMHQPYFKYQDMWTINKEIQYAFVPDLRCYIVFVFIDSIRDIVLLEGQVMNSYTNEVYRSPAYIPRSARKLQLPKPKLFRNKDHTISYVQSIKLMIIPVQGMEATTVLACEEAEAQIVNHDFSNCPYHVSLTKGKVDIRRPKIDANTFQIRPELSASVVANPLRG